ncbi:MAG TPA: methyltransferase domain-containing protein [Candidatus Acidoferrales bacterium]|nr:methyltransferase domain-containing protein [Candidatus Acidoferrales bacterium]
MSIDRWTSGADYDQWMGRWSRLLAQEFLAWLRLPAGLRWIDVCCGSGMITEAIVERNAPKSVVGVDASSGQISFARQHRAHPNVAFETADAMALPFPDSSFDVAVCGLGLNFIPSPSGALDEFRRVARPGGTIAVYVWDYAHGARFLREFWDAAIAVDPEAAAFDQARRFPMCTQEGLRSLFEEAKLEDLSQRALDVVTRFATFEDYWEPFLAGQGSAPNYLATRAEHIRTAIRERLREKLPTNAHGAIELPARAWAIRARKKP